MKKTAISVALVLICAFASAQGNFQIPDEDTYGYFFAHQSANGAWTAYALSPDAIHFHSLICGNAIMDNAGAPYVCRTRDGKGFIMTVADARGGIEIKTSPDLLDWKAAVAGPALPRGTSVRGPQLIWDAQKSSYLLYFSLLDNAVSRYFRIYGCYVDASFKKMSEPVLLADWGASTIDPDITWLPSENKYCLIAKKDGGAPGFYMSKSTSLTGPWEDPQYIAFEGDDVCTGASVFHVAGQEAWQIGYVDYSSEAFNYRLCKADPGMGRFFSPQNIEGIYGPQQGSFLTLTEAEYKALQAWSDQREVQYLAPDVNNPVFPGLYADPEVLYSHQTGKYYIFPTTDGAYQWHNYDFHCFSSEDFKTWKDEGVILDLRNLSWGKEYAWAPCIIERKVGNSYKYYYYFVANKSIGVAVADKPEGPYKDALGKPMLSQEELNTPNQVIDPDVFQDPKTGKYYLYWGNSYLWMAELADDMISLVPGSIQELIPRSRIGEYHYLEGTYVFERNGLYYFMWSENITRSSYYRVRYLISDSPVEFVRDGKPAKVEDTIVIQQDPSKQIFGTGHNAVINIPGTDEWYIVYHRFTRPEGVKMGPSGGYNREVCIDRMKFNPDGTIIPVKPTL
ncbi:MAG: family 43 glycosylhydrolase [Bacteroidales bacterium]|nr:family 43 glycosylhydrolase [Bacteroidales bacterium]